MMEEADHNLMAMLIAMLGGYGNNKIFIPDELRVRFPQYVVINSQYNFEKCGTELWVAIPGDTGEIVRKAQRGNSTQAISTLRQVPADTRALPAGTVVVDGTD